MPRIAGALPATAIESAFFEGHGPIARALAAHQPIVAVEQNIERQVFWIGFVNHLEVPGDRRIAKAEVGCMQHQQSAGLQTAGEIANHPVKSLEVKQGIAALRARGSEIAIDQDREAEDRVIGVRGFAGCRSRTLKHHVRGIFRPHPRQATSDVARVDIDAFDGGGREIFAQAKNFFPAGAAKRQHAQVGPRPDARGRKSEQPRITIGLSVVIGLEFSGYRSPDSAVQRVSNVPYGIAALARNTSQCDQLWKLHNLAKSIAR